MYKLQGHCALNSVSYSVLKDAQHCLMSTVFSVRYPYWTRLILTVALWVGSYLFFGYYHNFIFRPEDTEVRRGE